MTNIVDPSEYESLVEKGFLPWGHEFTSVEMDVETREDVTKWTVYYTSIDYPEKRMRVIIAPGPDGPYVVVQDDLVI